MGWVDGGDGGRGTTPWLQPGERVLWRGRPDAGRVFAPQDAVLIPVTACYLGFLVAFGSSIGGIRTIPGAIVVSLFMVLALYLLVGRFVVTVWTRRRTRYAVTDHRAVMTVRGRPRGEVPLTSPMVVRRSRDRRRGTAVWDLTFPSTSAPGPPPAAGRSVVADLFRGTGWPLVGLVVRDELAFVDVVGIDGALAAVRAAGYAAPVEATARPGLTGLLPRTPTSWTAARTTPAGRKGRVPRGVGAVRHWVRTRLLRERYEVWSPLPPSEVTGRLARDLIPGGPYTLRPPFRRGGFQGTATERYVRMLNRRTMGNNSWQFVFEGVVAADPPGTVLTGDVGPSGFTRVFSGIWCTIVVVVFVVGVVGTITEFATGKTVTLVPAIFVPLGMLTFFVALTEVGARSARRDWDELDRWLRWLLEVPAPPAA